MNLCYNRFMGKKHQQLEIGSKINALTIVKCLGLLTYEQVTKLGKHYDKKFQKRTFYKCVCVCGTVNIQPASLLQQGKPKTCGCSRFTDPEAAAVNRVYTQYKWGAKVRSLRFELSIEELKSIASKPCFYCGMKDTNESQDQRGRNPKRWKYTGIDRFYNKFGYTKSNCVPCCITCNERKRAMDGDEFIAWVKSINDRVRVEYPNKERVVEDGKVQFDSKSVSIDSCRSDEPSDSSVVRSFCKTTDS